MMAKVDDLITRHPRLYHMAEGGSWDSILKYGLLSTSALLDLFEISGAERTAIESEWRSSSVEIAHHLHGRAVIRDQKPMPPSTLAPVLIDMTPSDWYKVINRKTFFWLSLERLNRFLNAAPYRRKVHDVIVVDTRDLLRQNLDRVTIAPFNTGVSSFGPRFMRGSATFQTIEDVSLQSSNSPAVELAVDYKVSNIEDLALEVQQRRGNELLCTFWRR